MEAAINQFNTWIIWGKKKTYSFTNIFFIVNEKKKYINEKTNFFKQRTYHWFHKYHANHNTKKFMTYDVESKIN